MNIRTNFSEYTFRLSLFVLFVALFGAGPVAAATVVVAQGGGGDFPAIQPALTAAATGDTIRVMPGIYTGSVNLDLNYGGKDLIVIGHLGADVTIIDAQGGSRAVDFDDGETGAAVFRGFTVTGCAAGGAIRVSAGSAPQIRDCIIEGNDALGASGAGIASLSASPDIIGCIIVANSTSGGGGGLLLAGGAPSVTDCTIIGNQADGRGGGVWITDGATVTITSSTIAANAADLGASGLNGGGLILTGASSVTVTRSIIWGNTADLGDDILAGAGSTVNLVCSLYDATGSAGPGAILPDGMTLTESPRFCYPAYGSGAPWTFGDFTLAANSPAAAANSPCGQLIGSQPVGCGDLVVWTGAGGNSLWSDALNWSSGSVPDSTSFVQITRGSVVIDQDAAVANLVQDSESGAPDSLLITNGATLAYYAVSFPGKADVEKSSYQIKTVVGDGEILFPCLPYCPGNTGCPDLCEDTPIQFADWSYWILYNATILGDEFLGARHTYFIPPGGIADFQIPLAVLVPADLQIQGTANFASSTVNLGVVDVGQFGTMVIDGEFLNTDTGTATIAGNVTGIGSFANEGLVNITSQGTVSFDVPLANNVVPGQAPQPGIIDVASGLLAMGAGLTNAGLVQVAAGAELSLDFGLTNETTGSIELAGDISGVAPLSNYGAVERLGPGQSLAALDVLNLVDPVTGDAGALLVSSGQLQVDLLLNDGAVAMAAGATLETLTGLGNSPLGLVGGKGLLDFPNQTLQNFGSITPGFSPGILDFTGSLVQPAGGRLEVEIDGPVPGTGHDQLRVDGAINLGGTLLVRIDDTFQYVAGDSFTVVRQVGIGGGTTQFGPDCLSGTQVAGKPELLPVSFADRLVLVAQAGAWGNAAPVAVYDTFTVPPGATSTLDVAANDFDPEGADLTLARLETTGSKGRAFIEPGLNQILYYPPFGFTGEDTVIYWVTDCVGAESEASVLIIVDALSGVSDETVPQAAFRIHNVVPNPFNPATRITYEIRQPGDARLAVYDLRGRLVQVLADGYHDTGPHQMFWRGKNAQGQEMPSGLYFVRLESGESSRVRKMMLLR